ncbi:MAG: VOC family protein [Candidatus Aminicenantes bacterium]|nr:VOC family protein [Candidatus Aminicenantes bacterium]
MKIAHIGLIASSEKKADQFYLNLLGLKKSGPKKVEAYLAKNLFNLNQEVIYLSYFNENICFEIFISPQIKPKLTPHHICLEIDNLENFLEQCSALGLPVKRIIKGEKEIIFISDFDGHLFEIKKAPLHLA